MTDSNPYETLGLEPDATDDEIKRAYKKMATKHHPDRGGDTDKFLAIKDAFKKLRLPIKEEADQVLERVFINRIREMANHKRFPNITDSVKSELEALIVGIERDLNQGRYRLKKLQEMSGRVDSTGDDNLFENLLGKEIDAGNTFIATLERQHKVVTLAINQLKDYVDQRPEEAEQSPQWGYHG